MEPQRAVVHRALAVSPPQALVQFLLTLNKGLCFCFVAGPTSYSARPTCQSPVPNPRGQESTVL